MQVALTLTGRSGLVMHNGRLADPLDPISQELAKLTDKHNRTPAEEAEVADVEWKGSLYWDSDIGAYVPAANILRCLRDAATAWKLGEAVYRSVVMMDDRFPLQHDGPTTLGALAKRDEYRLRATVKIGRNRVPRTRPIFRKWGLTFNVEVDETELSPADFERIVERAGRLGGIGDARKLGYGRFTATIQ
jgi:hypothetical protein